MWVLFLFQCFKPLSQTLKMHNEPQDKKDEDMMDIGK